MRVIKVDDGKKDQQIEQAFFFVYHIFIICRVVIALQWMSSFWRNIHQNNLNDMYYAVFYTIDSQKNLFKLPVSPVYCMITQFFFIVSFFIYLEICLLSSFIVAKFLTIQFQWWIVFEVLCENWQCFRFCCLKFLSLKRVFGEKKFLWSKFIQYLDYNTKQGYSRLFILNHES